MTSVNLHAALWYASVGRPVFPCIEHAGDKAKSPYTPKGFKDATTDRDLITQWWTEHPNALIGAPPLPNEVVLDIDPVTVARLRR
jgi:putative DNA primase/helicase